MTPFSFVWLALAMAVFSADPPTPNRSAPYVEFDFSTLPGNSVGAYSLTLIVLTADKDLKYRIELKGPKRIKPDEICASFSSSMKDNRFEAEVVGMTRLRVYGRIWNGKLIPATEGKVESKNLKKKELPKITNPRKA